MMTRPPVFLRSLALRSLALRSLALRLLLALFGAVAFGAGAALADAAPFDLAGPGLQVQVTHAGVTLPIGEVPNLAPGDQLQIRADLPASQSAPYLLVAAFLRGATNPPPANWFFRDETWTRKGQGGLRLAVPEGAQQLVVFLAPRTGGDFRTLVGAVRGRPGAFVRASQDLNQASLDRARLDAFLDAVRSLGPADAERLKTVSPLLARSLMIKLDADCFQKAPELQAPCLMQRQNDLVLNDGHSTSIVEALTSGAPADLALELSASPKAEFGYYSPYVAAVMDMARILDSFQTAQFQYLPALAIADGSHIALRLNTPPSFHNPLSVLVTALPAVEPPQAPPLAPVDPKAAYCAEQASLVLPVEGAPLAYATAYAHDMALRLKTRDGRTVDLPVKADAEKGGFVADTGGFRPADFGYGVQGVLHGDWGFQPFDGPQFRLQSSAGGAWRLVPDDAQALVVGRSDTVRLQGPAAACVEGVTLKTPDGEPQPVDWKPAPDDRLALTLPLTDAEPGDLTLLVKAYGSATPDAVPVQAFAQAGHLESLSLHAGDLDAVLKGSRLDEVAGVSVGGADFVPGALTSAGGTDALALSTTDAAAAARLRPGQTLTAKVALKDGRKASLKLAVAPPRPAVSLIGRSVQPTARDAPIAIRLTDADELAGDAVLTFSVRAVEPQRFSGHTAIEAAVGDPPPGGPAPDQAGPGAPVLLTSANGGLTLEDDHVAVATLDLAKAFGPSAFGPLRFRIVEDGVAGDWRPLATLVRLPVLSALKCRDGPSHDGPGREAAAQPCALAGSDLFLISALSASPDFADPSTVPEGFTGSALEAPHPHGGRLYLRLRDDPAVVNEAVAPERR